MGLGSVHECEGLCVHARMCVSARVRFCFIKLVKEGLASACCCAFLLFIMHIDEVLIDVLCSSRQYFKNYFRTSIADGNRNAA